MRGGEDLLEPYVAYRKLSETNNTLDIGLYYTYNDKITAGAAMRSGKVVNATLAFRFSKYLMVGYSREMIVGNVGGFVGSANEFTVRYDFNNESYKVQLEAIAQVGGLLMMKHAETGKKLAYFMAANEVKWRKPVRPGDTLIIEVELTKARGKICKANGVCKVNDEVVSEAEVTFMLRDAE